MYKSALRIMAVSSVFCVVMVGCLQEKKFKPRAGDRVFWQAHRGGGAHEAPDNTMAANHYTWKLGGIPEADIRTTKDGVIICLHDGTLARTTTAPPDVNRLDVGELTFEEIRRWDAGVKFNKKFKGQVVPSLKEVFDEMKGHPDRQVYLDIKRVDLKKLGQSPKQSDCKTLKEIAAGVRTMLWIGGDGQEIRKRFEKAVASGFGGLDQVQLHLNDNKDKKDWRYQIETDFVKEALQKTQNARIDLEVFPRRFDEGDIHTLLDMGIRWYATDEPERFSEAVEKWQWAKYSVIH